QDGPVGAFGLGQPGLERSVPDNAPLRAGDGSGRRAEALSNCSRPRLDQQGGESETFHPFPSNGGPAAQAAGEFMNEYARAGGVKETTRQIVDKSSADYSAG